MKLGRNDPCPCGSGKKYKKCCLDKQAQPSQALYYRRLSEAHSESQGKTTSAEQEEMMQHPEMRAHLSEIIGRQQPPATRRSADLRDTYSF